MAGIQTSKITTNASDDLVLDPASGKEVQVKSVDATNPGETPISVNSDGTVKRLDVAALTELSDTDPGDYILIQAGSSRADSAAGSAASGNLYKIDSEKLGGTEPADPFPGDITAVPPFLGGNGTAGNPYVITPATVYTPGGRALSEQYITISGQDEYVPVPFTDLSQNAGNRFTQPAGLTDSSGSYSFNLIYNDAPNTPLGDGQVYHGSTKVGTSSVYFKWDVTQIANLTQFGPASSPTASPTTVNYAADDKYGTVSAIWADGVQLLSATNMVFSVNGGSLSANSKAVNDGDQVKIGFVDATVAAASDGATIEGTLEGETYHSEFSMVKDIVPKPFTIASVSNAPVSSEAETANNPIKGINAPTTLTSTGSSANPLSGVKVSINGATAAASGTFNPGDTLQAFGTTGSASGTTYQATFTCGGVDATWDVTTSSVSATIKRPTIVSPLNGAPDLVPNVILSSDAYTAGDVTNPPGPHTTSTWEVYETDPVPVISSSIVTSNRGDGDPLVLSQVADSDLVGDVVMVDTLTPNSVGGETQSSAYILTTNTIANVAEVAYPAVHFPNGVGGKVNGPRFESGMMAEWFFKEDDTFSRDNVHQLFGSNSEENRILLDSIGMTWAPQAISGAASKRVPWGNFTYYSGGWNHFLIIVGSGNACKIYVNGGLVFSDPLYSVGSSYFIGMTRDGAPGWHCQGYLNNYYIGPSSGRYDYSTLGNSFTPPEVNTLSSSGAGVYFGFEDGQMPSWSNRAYNKPQVTNVGSPTSKLTFSSPNPDLKYFKSGDTINEQSGVKVVSTDIANNTMVVDKGQWLGSNGSGNPSGSTSITSGPYTAKGKVATKIGTSVTLLDASGRWIGSGSENKAGKTFYAATVEQVAPGAPSDPVDASKYSVITPSATTLTSATLNNANLNSNKFYYSRVKYADDSSTGSLVESEFSDYHNFGTS